MKNSDPITHRQGFHLIMRDVDRGDPQRTLQGEDFRAHLVPQTGVQIGQWLIQKQDPGEPPGPGRGRPVAAGRRSTGRSAGHHIPPVGPDPEPAPPAPSVPTLESCALGVRRPRFQRRSYVEKVHNFETPSRCRAFGEEPRSRLCRQTGSPLGWSMEAGDHPQSRRLPATAGAEESENSPSRMVRFSCSTPVTDPNLLETPFSST